MSSGAIAGIVIGCIAGVAIICVAVLLLIMKDAPPATFGEAGGLDMEELKGADGKALTLI